MNTQQRNKHTTHWALLFGLPVTLSLSKKVRKYFLTEKNCDLDLLSPSTVLSLPEIPFCFSLLISPLDYLCLSLGRLIFVFMNFVPDVHTRCLDQRQTSR